MSEVGQKTVMHMDMDAFFASVEQVDNPEYKGRPVIIGCSDRGVVSAASYEARVFGVHSAMPVVQARRLCPHGVYLPGRMRRYRDVSKSVMHIVRDMSPLVEQTSVDEAYVDITGTGRLFGPPEVLARKLKDRIYRKTGLTCSVGIAPNKYLAKICSDINKPNGIFILSLCEVEGFLEKLPVGKVPGIGKRTLEVLRKYNVATAGDILKFSETFWKGTFGPKGGEFLYRRARGIDNSPVEPSSEPKSSGAENTFERDETDFEVLETWLWSQAERVGRDLRKNGYFGKTVTLKIKFSDFTVRTRSLSLSKPVQSTRDIFDAAKSLLQDVPIPIPVRLIGVSVSNFSRGERQMRLFESGRDEKPDRLDKALDALQERFGDKIVQHGRTFGFIRKRH